MATKSQVFTSSGTFNVPAGVSLVWVTMIGSGGSSGQSAGGWGGGGAGHLCVRYPVKVTPSGTVTVTIGAGGIGSTGPIWLGRAVAGAGNPTLFGSISIDGARVCRATGSGGVNYQGPHGGNGGGPGGGLDAANLPQSHGAFGFGGPGNATNSFRMLGYLSSPVSYGGSGGGQGGSYEVAGSAGEGSGGVAAGGSGGTSGATFGAGGGGGAGTIWGPGGNGSNGVFSGAVPGDNAPATSYGAGAGGAGGNHSSTNVNGSNGADGYCMVEWAG